jgi:hypothetical protein
LVLVYSILPITELTPDLQISIEKVIHRNDQPGGKGLREESERKRKEIQEPSAMFWESFPTFRASFPTKEGGVTIGDGKGNGDDRRKEKEGEFHVHDCSTRFNNNNKKKKTGCPVLDKHLSVKACKILIS